MQAYGKAVGESVFGELFKPTNDQRTRTELVIFIRPTIISSAAVDTIMKDTGMDKSPISLSLLL